VLNWIFLRILLFPEWLSSVFPCWSFHRGYHLNTFWSDQDMVIL
jgi:hypothetical protein